MVRIRSREELSLLMDAVAVIRTVCPDVPQEYLAASFERLPARATIPEWADRWLKKATRFMAMPPIPDDPKFRLLESGAAMEAAGRELSNCLAEKTTACSVGRSGFLVYDDPPLAIIELARLENGGHTAWALDSICPPGNGRVLTSVAREIVEN